jgi:hypothetical protein
VVSARLSLNIDTGHNDIAAQIKSMVVWRWTGPAVCQDYASGPYGGGDYTDVVYRDAYGAITAVRLRCGKYVDK